MEKKKKKIWIIGGLILCLVAVIGITFAFFSTGGTQDTANTFTSGCLNIELTDASSSINLTNTYPISDVEGVDTTSYDFTIRNTCDTSTNYSINLESLNQVSNSLNADYIKVSLSSNTVDNVISKLSDNTSTTPEIDGAYTLYTGSINAHEEKTYHLKLWIDYDATVEQAANKIYSSKINVIANPETSVVDTLEAKFTLDDKTLTSSLSDNVTSATYCTTTTNICEPTTTASITNNSYTVELEENENNQMVCTKLNGTSKVICSNGLEVKNPCGEACQTILAQEGGAEAIEAKGTPDFSKTATTDEGMYAAEDDYGTTYYYRGAVNDNWFEFGTNSSGQPLYWRIVRINGDGSIRLIYNGTSTTTEGDSTMINTVQAFNTSYNNNAYVGYMYENNQVHGLTTNSSIKTTLDNWYIDNLKDEYAEYLDGNAGFCGDRTSTTTDGGAPNDTGGTGTTATYYGASYRLHTNKTPTFKCSDIDNDLYTTPGSSKGNGALIVNNSNDENYRDETPTPIGLITADEVAFAGGVYGTSNSSYYLYSNYAVYWTMSPYNFDGSIALVFRVSSSGSLNDYRVPSPYGVRPVINIRANVELTGTGSQDNPFKVVGAN